MPTSKADDDARTAFCPSYHRAFEILGPRWTGEIIRALLAGCDRFRGITKEIPGLSDRILAERLKHLERHGIVERLVHDETPVRIEYRLTSMGHDLVGVVDSISGWADRWVDPA